MPFDGKVEGKNLNVSVSRVGLAMGSFHGKCQSRFMGLGQILYNLSCFFLIAFLYNLPMIFKISFVFRTHRYLPFGMIRNPSHHSPRLQPTRTRMLPRIRDCSRPHPLRHQHPSPLHPRAPWTGIVPGWKTN